MRLSARMIAIAVFGALLMPALMVCAQDSRGTNDGTPKAELFVGYSYLRAVPAPSDGNRLVWLNGGSTSIAYNFTRHLGLVGDFGGFDDSQLLLKGTGATPDSSGRSTPISLVHDIPSGITKDSRHLFRLCLEAFMPAM